MIAFIETNNKNNIQIDLKRLNVKIRIKIKENL